jgi:hypothetical protein
MNFWNKIRRLFLNTERETLKVLATDNPARGQWWTDVEIVDAGKGKLTLDGVDGAVFDLRQKGLVESHIIQDGYQVKGYEDIPRYVWRVTKKGREELAK